MTSYNDQGFPTTVTVPVGVSTRYDQRGFQVTVYPSNCPTKNLPLQVGNVLAPTGTNTEKDIAGELATGTPAPLPTSIDDLLGSGASKLSAAWVVLLCTVFCAVVIGALFAP